MKEELFDFFKRVLFRAILPPLLGLAVCVLIINSFPEMSEEASMAMTIIVLTISQIPMMMND